MRCYLTYIHLFTFCRWVAEPDEFAEPYERLCLWPVEYGGMARVLMIARPPARPGRLDTNTLSWQRCFSEASWFFFGVAREFLVLRVFLLYLPSRQFQL